MHTTLRNCIFAAALVASLLGFAKRSHAQAWAGEEGELVLTLGSNFQFANRVFGSAIGTLSGLPTQALQNSLGAEITPIERLTISASASHTINRYTGPTDTNAGILIAHGSQDDGDWHGSFDDALFEVRYQLLDGAIALSPRIRAKVPMTDYETSGHAATGTGLWEAGGGLFVGKFGLFAERMFGQAGYTFNLVEKETRGGAATEEFSMHYSLFNGLLGYLFSTSFFAVAGAELQWTHGGFQLSDLANEAGDSVIRTFHDPILSRRYLAVQAGANYDITDTFSLLGTFGIIVWGDNVSDGKSVALNASWTTMLFE